MFNKPTPSPEILAMQDITLENQLPGKQIPYYIKNDEGERWLVSGMVLNIMARGEESNGQYQVYTLTGGKGAGLPLHRYNHAQLGFYLTTGQLDLWLDNQRYLLNAGDYASIPAGSVFAFHFKAHRTKALVFATGNEVTQSLSAAGKEYAGHVQPEGELILISAEQQQHSSANGTVTWLGKPDQEMTYTPAGKTLPTTCIPYVLAAGEGERYVAADQIFTFLGNTQTSHGKFLVVMNEGPKGDMVPPHFHVQHSEIFYPLEGNVTMIANKEILVAEPGDAVFVSPGTIHGYQLNNHYTKFIGFLTPGIFESFFKILGNPSQDHIFPQQPAQLNFGRVLERLDELDLYLCGAKPE